MNENVIVPISARQESLRQLRLGEAIAHMYVAAQHTSRNASDAACDAIMQEGSIARVGFNLAMAKTPYPTRA